MNNTQALALYVGYWRGPYWAFYCCDYSHRGQLPSFQASACFVCGKVWTRPEGDPGPLPERGEQ